MRKLVLLSSALMLFNSFSSVAETIHFPEEFVPLQVGERLIEQSFFSRVDDVELAPGTYQVKMKYTDLYEQGYDDHQVVESEPFWVELTVESGKDYDLVFNRANNAVAAEVFAEAPQVSLKAKGSELAVPLSIVSYRVASTPVQAVASAPVAATSNKPATAKPVTLPAKVPGGQAGLKNMPNAAAMLEFWWQQASPEERRAFLQKVSN
ncbi:DUF2057 domain-containing protein [Pseudoalteromonas shioyasakiensis]|uniref:DUF2057 domain-containing protein n=1 Tax=Pseudoalteromonas TaxID=53246 RepID=UPI000C93A63B|nr:MULTISPECIES: DUF2057 domain-containing protein [Pseudoalteromonas]MAD05612.1 DUF2057 domain-containing protein [Pseudoalteromonas sp.]MCG9710850.1 DUF2057 domain-containing protein [Pseudoalteromonas sp. Isolate3]MCQ8883312.1 DUF2057 domain-containing protein [Pseudoalteromonas shioyasakiensis]RZD21463.1 DUF2057 domain-containing protein [Pseudoalteromonas sp. MEBiC 03485]|tara:strand:- start:4900 stop:5523 length:624 start_codon:yes stop_codon:yes gene_type:complete